ncbi:MAG TPA: type ISP restriction/modification enzyme [Rhodanobacteraceae bacterium]|nr:type ISP restriction/modification enzyme [Rhodanobacteraceae bacterium]
MSAVVDYIAAIDRAHRRGDATEHTYRPALKALLEAHGPNIEATNEPQRIAGNAPDFVVRRGATVLGHVEAKDVGEPLDRLLKSPQMKRYAEALPNLVFTDYLEFIWIEHGAPRLRARLGEETPRGIVASADAQAEWDKFAQTFYNAVAPTVATPRQLAHLLAAQTRLLRDATLNTLNHEGEAGALAAQHRAFRDLLVPELDAAEFADMFAQTVAYGLFTARVFDPTQGDFSLREAETLIPRASPFLRQLFRFIAFDLSDGVRWIAESIVDALLHADLDKVLHRQSRKRGFADPIFHFYETFLAEYDPHLRESRGVYYTPAPVVDFIVRGIEHLLKTEFGRTAGLADPDTVILDPATGTATFLREVIDRIYRHQVDAGMQSTWPDYVRKHLLPRLFGFELMMAPYTVAHLKLALELAERGFHFEDGDRLNVYLTNTLDRIQGKTGALMAQWLTQEAEGAERVKDQVPVEVVLGNPPYSGESRNKSDWIAQLMELYKREPNGGKLQERNSKWINADEIKFIRFAHWRIAQTGHGIVGYIASHSWLDGPIFRGMRAALLRDFDEIYILDLHGNSNKKERTPDAHAHHGDDKNVFDIQQGVAILFLLRKPGQHERKATVRHTELWGSRESKYQRLEDSALEDLEWRELEPLLPQLPFVPVNRDAWNGYEGGWPVTTIFPLNSVGLLTARDELCIKFDAASMWRTVKDFVSLDEEAARTKYKLGPDVRDWRVAWAQQDIRASGLSQDKVAALLYRPFDVRYTYYTGHSRGFLCYPRAETMSQLLGDNDNIALMTSRLTKGENFAHAQVSKLPVEVISMSSKTSNNAFVFPLWLLPEHDTLDPARNVRHPNLDPRYLQALADALGVGVSDPFGLPEGVTPEDVFNYIYAVLHAPTYRSRYAEYLRSDFPRIALPDSVATFRALAALGEKLVEWHLLRDPSLQSGGPAYPVSGEHAVEKIRYEEPGGGKPGRVWINARQYFDGIDPEIWAFRIGGYQVLEKWLKDRKGRRLDIDDITHYRKIAVALARTRQLMDDIDAAAAPLLVEPPPEE